MKTITTVIAVVLLLLRSPGALGQEGDIFGAIMEAAAAQENAGNQAQSEADNAAQSEAAAEWQAEWERKMEENAEILEALDTKYLKCTAMMVLYVYEYLKLWEMTEAETNCIMKYDLYGMQLLYLTSSTTIMYCPEEIASLSVSEQRKIEDDFINVFSNHFGWDDMHDWSTIYDPVEGQEIVDLSLSSGGPYASLLGKILAIMEFTLEAIRSDRSDRRYEEFELGNIIRTLTSYFSPDFIVLRAMDIGQKMEALGCGG